MADEDLKQRKCAKRKAEDAFDAEAVMHHLSEIPAWMVDPEVTTIARTFDFRNFKEALAFVQRIGELAEAEGHHPNIHIHEYKHVTLTLSTHDVGGLTENDFIVAAKVDAMYE